MRDQPGPATAPAEQRRVALPAVSGKVVVFLDFDGVVSTPRAKALQGDKPDPDRWIDPLCVRAVNMLCQASGALIVVSSSWRKDTTRRRFGAMMTRNGFIARLHEDWRTASLPGLFRGNEVAEWLGRHPEVERHLILDDEDDFDPNQPLVRTDALNGIQLPHLRAAFRILCPDDPHALMHATDNGLGVGRKPQPRPRHGTA